jgi:hypothetical protein
MASLSVVRSDYGMALPQEASGKHIAVHFIVFNE